MPLRAAHRTVPVPGSKPAPRPGLRVLRGTVSGLVCGLGAVWAHTTISGHDVGAIGLVVVLASMAACIGLGRRRLEVPVLLGVTLTVQAAGHLAMATATVPQHHHHGTVASPGEQPFMLLAHLSVALVTAVLAHGGQRVLLHALGRLVQRLLPRLVQPVLVPSPWKPAWPLLHAATPRRLAPGGLGSRAPPARDPLAHPPC